MITGLELEKIALRLFVSLLYLLNAYFPKIVLHACITTLNGKYTEMGYSQDVVYDKAQEDFVKIGITGSEKKEYMHIKSNDNSEALLSIITLICGDTPGDTLSSQILT